MAKRFFDILEHIFCFIMSGFMIIMVVAVFYQVFLRYIFNSPNIWAEELARYCLIYISLFASAVAIRRYNHIRIDFFVNFFPKKTWVFFNLFAYILMLVFLIFLFYYGVKITLQTGNQITSGLKLPISYIYVSIPIGTFFMIVFIIENLYREFVKPAFFKEDPVK
jgi:C4-dicarboxylate transporter DctQ subunit